MNIYGVQCLKCGVTIYPRDDFDSRSCECGNVNFPPFILMPTSMTSRRRYVKVDFCQERLTYDRKSGENKLGLIKADKDFQPIKDTEVS